MTDHWLDTDLLLDITVNIIPLVTLAIFVLLYTFFNPWGIGIGAADALPTLVMYGHLLFTLTMLALVTYLAAKYISRDERGR